jgi:preprotein translocase subunit YajC
MLLTLLLQEPAAQGQGMIPQVLMIGAIILIFYFFMIRPQQQKQKDLKNFISEVKKGDDVVTIGGLHGKVISIEDTIITLEVDRGVRLTFDKSAISLDASKKQKKA